MGLLALPETAGLDVDSPEATAVCRAVIRRKPFLRRHYEEMYAVFRAHAAELAAFPGIILELGSGAGFLKELLPEVVTSDVFAFPGIDRVVQADALPFKPGELKAVFMLNVLHHLPRPADFLREADRCLADGGRVVMIEPCRTWFSRILYKYFHPEPFDDSAADWNPRPAGRLTGSNQAIPWLIFHRDRGLFERLFPRLRIRSIARHSVLGYPLSGGLSMRSLAPSSAYPAISALDRGLSWIGPGIFPIFETIVLEKSGVG